jgi:L-2,4-diaminobutyrate decarboxylase
MMESLLNNSGAVHEMGMAISSLEKILTNWFSKKIGFPEDTYGIITSGGTLANLTALLTARAVKAPEDVWTLGAQTRLAILVSEEAHYCIDRAARIMGLGEQGVIKVPVSKYFQMRTELLEDLLADARAKGLHVFAIVGSACSTSTGSFDDLEKIADFAEKHGIWMHVDGAHGGAAILSEKYKHLLRGIERADSAIVDFHKLMMIPSLSTGVFYRNPSDSFHTFATKASYLFATQDEDWYNTGKRTFECTKPGAVLRLYSVLRAHGEQVFGDAVEHLFDLGKTFAAMIRRNPAFELAVEPETNIVCFRYVGDRSQPLDELNHGIRQRLVEDGRFYLVSTVLNDVRYLRVSLMNPLTTEKELAELLEEIAHTSRFALVD